MYLADDSAVFSAPRCFTDKCPWPALLFFQKQNVSQEADLPCLDINADTRFPQWLQRLLDHFSEWQLDADALMELSPQDQIALADLVNADNRPTEGKQDTIANCLPDEIKRGNPHGPVSNVSDDSSNESTSDAEEEYNSSSSSESTSDHSTTNADSSEDKNVKTSGPNQKQTSGTLFNYFTRKNHMKENVDPELGLYTSSVKVHKDGSDTTMLPQKRDANGQPCQRRYVTKNEKGTANATLTPNKADSTNSTKPTGATCNKFDTTEKTTGNGTHRIETKV